MMDRYTGITNKGKEEVVTRRPIVDFGCGKWGREGGDETTKEGPQTKPMSTTIPTEPSDS